MLLLVLTFKPLQLKYLFVFHFSNVACLCFRFRFLFSFFLGFIAQAGCCHPGSCIGELCTRFCSSAVVACELSCAEWVRSLLFLPRTSLQWSIKEQNASDEALQQYRLNLTAMAAPLERLAEHSEVYWLLQGEASWGGKRNKKQKVTKQMIDQIMFNLNRHVFVHHMAPGDNLRRCKTGS